MNNMELQSLIKEAHGNAVKHGFYDGDEPNRDSVKRRMAALIICEMAEFVEADRQGKWLFSGELFAVEELKQKVSEASSDFNRYYDEHVKGCAEEELADICIRCFDLLGYMDAGKDASINKSYPFAQLCASASAPELCYFLCLSLICDGSPDCDDVVSVIKGVESWCHWNGVALMLHIKAKMLYNTNRPYKHGKKY